ncbi:hypothetical protein [Prauserella muralis]|uniref:Uncharacterized protein n=1 Tax=Prauserella muralis TaxID=588067 RepID=A0A2V4ANL3_9PSEU|nr:hypothetical protein [Prauserella muralis]PXY22192.1 hypothetical protein BAY60_20085 [Prauserella muralis]TWE27802.1 hypothetical protein FHX69_0449 [Prauserella muralis]TWE27820.1 hypothetical protein FHX69_0468 [Prauserella muralis]
MRPFVPAAATAVALPLLAACGDTPPTDRMPPAPPSVSSTTTPTSPPAKPGEEITVRGTVASGVEPNCLVLSAGGREYLLLEPEPVLKPGVQAVVRGRTHPNQATTCMQGTPLRVLDAWRA